MKKHFLPLLFLIIFSAFSLRSIFQPGFMYSHDSFWHVQRIQNMKELIGEQFPVRWSPTLDNGYGIPLFNFAYPAPYYLGALFMYIGLGPVKAYYALLFLAYFAGGGGGYFLARSRLIGIFASLLYLLTPYQFLDIFVRGALGEVFALGLFPWVVMSYQDISRTGKIKWHSPIPLALLLLSHNFYAFLFSGILLLLILCLSSHRALQIKSIFISLSLSAFFVLPALSERNNLLITTVEDGSLYNHFISFKDLVYSKWGYLGSVVGSNPGEMSLQLGIANLVVVALAGFYRSKRHLVYLATLFAAVFMTLEQSAWIWDRIPLLVAIQFPWRFVGLTPILFILIYLELKNQVTPKHYKKFVIASIVLVLIALVNTRNYYRPVKWLSEAEFMSMHFEYLDKTTTAHRDELVPRWAVLERNLPGESLVLSGGAELVGKAESALSLEFVATSPDGEGSAIYHRNYYPSWALTIDSERGEIVPTPTGEIQIKLLEGEHSYKVKVTSTPVAKVANLISLIAWFFLGYQIVLELKSRSRVRSSPPRTSKRA